MKTPHSIFLICLAALALTSCDNFLKGSKIREDLERNIEYENADKYLIKVNALKGSGVVTKPAGSEAEVRPSDTFNLSFNSESDTQFVKWEAYNAVTNEALEDETYLKIEDPLMVETTCTFVKDPEDENILLAVRAITAKRPRIILSTPTYQETGAPRGANVQIMFDNFDMEKNCIYYTTEEMEELKKNLKLKDEDFLQGDSQNCNGQYYGYMKNEIKYFKNIEIISSPVIGSSLTQYYYDPYWEKQPNDMGGSTLVIQVTNPPPPKGVKIYITLSKDFCYYEDNIAVKLREATTLTYKTNVEKENTAPQIFVPKDEQNNDIYNVMKFKNSNGEYEILPFTTDISKVPDYVPVCSKIDFFTMSFNFSATDEGGSCIANRFRLCYESEEGTPSIELPYSFVSRDEGVTNWSDEYLIKRNAYLRSAKKYCFTLEAIDNDGNAVKLKDNSDNHNTLYFWLNLDQNVPNY